VISVFQRLKAWFTAPKREKPTLVHSKSLRQMAGDIPDEMAEAMASRMKLDAERHRSRTDQETENE
jgi:hypothetical protein